MSTPQPDQGRAGVRARRRKAAHADVDARPLPSEGDRLWPGTDEIVRAIGTRLRVRREALGLSLRDVAASTGLSVSMVSLAERARTVPSIGTLVAICDALQLPMADLFASSARPHNPVIRREQQSLHPSSGGMTRRLVIYDEEMGLEVSEHEYVESGTSSEVLTHHTGQEVGLIIEGQLTVTLGEHAYVLEPGDCIRFDSRIPHRFMSTGPRPTRTLWLNVGVGRVVRPPDDVVFPDPERPGEGERT